jgi:hypothetical protein
MIKDIYITIKLDGTVLQSKVKTTVDSEEQIQAAKQLRMDEAKNYTRLRPSDLSWGIYQSLADTKPLIASENWR